MYEESTRPAQGSWLKNLTNKETKNSPCIKEVKIELSTPFKNTISLHPCNSTWSSRNLSNSQKKASFQHKNLPVFNCYNSRARLVHS